MEYFERIELLFAQLFSDTESRLSNGERDEISRFVSAGEYGIALHTAVWIFIEERKMPTDFEFGKLKSLADEMLDDSDPLRESMKVLEIA